MDLSSLRDLDTTAKNMSFSVDAAHDILGTSLISDHSTYSVRRLSAMHPIPKKPTKTIQMEELERLMAL